MGRPLPRPVPGPVLSHVPHAESETARPLPLAPAEHAEREREQALPLALADVQHTECEAEEPLPLTLADAQHVQKRMSQTRLVLAVPCCALLLRVLPPAPLVAGGASCLRLLSWQGGVRLGLQCSCVPHDEASTSKWWPPHGTLLPLGAGYAPGVHAGGPPPPLSDLAVFLIPRAPQAPS